MLDVVEVRIIFAAKPALPIMKRVVNQADAATADEFVVPGLRSAPIAAIGAVQSDRQGLQAISACDGRVLKVCTYNSTREKEDSSQKVNDRHQKASKRRDPDRS